MSTPFRKVQNVGNDFVLFLAEDLAPDADWPALARSVCDRRTAIGADGMLVLERADRPRQTMFNADGSEDYCGNGLSCCALVAHALEWAGPEFEIEHRGRVVPAVVLPDGWVRVTIGSASFEPAHVPLNTEMFAEPVVEGRIGPLIGSAVTTGSTHFVVFADTLPDDETLSSQGSEIEHHPAFPKKTSVIWAIDGGDRLDIRIWERGVGETLGCGTGAAAVAAVHMRLRDCGGAVEIYSAGGVTEVSAESWDSPLTLTCRPKVVYTGVV